MNLLINSLAGSGLLKKDLDYHVVRPSKVLMFVFFECQNCFEYEAQLLIPYISNGRYRALRRIGLLVEAGRRKGSGPGEERLSSPEVARGLLLFPQTRARPHAFERLFARQEK